MATLSGTLQRPDGAAITGYVRFNVIANPTVRGTVLALSRPVDVALATDGTFTASLCQGRYWVSVAGVHPWMIYLVSDTGTYRLENVTVWPVQDRGRVSVWLWNDDTTQYHRLVATDSGGALGLIVDEHGTTNPFGFQAASLWVRSQTDSLYYQVSISGVGPAIGLEINTTGDANPSGTTFTEVVVPSLDGDWVNSVVCVGAGVGVGLVVT